MAGGLASYHLLLLRAALSIHGNDFGRFYYATRTWLGGGSLYALNLATRIQAERAAVDFLDMNPPHFHLLVLPLATLSLARADVFWVALNALAGVVAGAMVTRELGLSFRIWHVLPVLCGVLLFAATGALSATGQFTGLLLLPLTAAWRSARHDRWGACGVWLGILVSVKPFLALFVPALLLMGRPRAVLLLALSLTACFAAGVLVFGWSAQIEWFTALRDVSWVWGRMNGSLLALFSRTLAPNPDFAPLLIRPSLVTPLWLIGASVVSIVSMFVARRSVDHAFGVIILGSLLVSPLGWVYYLWLALPPCVALWHNRVPRVSILGLVALTVPLVALLAYQPQPLATATIASAYSWGTLALWLGVVTRGSS